MFSIKVSLKDANKAKEYILKNNLLDYTRNFAKDNHYIYFPVNQKINNELSFNYTLSDKELSKKELKKSFKELLDEFLSPNELEKVKTSFDTVGDIAILEIDQELRSKEKEIADALLNSNPMIKTVLRKAGSHGGTFRTQEMEFLAGNNKKTTIHTENNVLLELNVEEVYFSVRLSTERKRISQQVKEGENILCMFSGCGPYPCVLSKNTGAAKIYGIEINPKGHEYALKNVKRNKLSNVYLENFDVHNREGILAEWKNKGIYQEKFDRITMPLPKTADEFLGDALCFAKQGTIIHFYDFLHEDQFFLAHEKIATACKDNSLNYEIMDTIKCGQHSPRVYRICVDFKIL